MLSTHLERDIIQLLCYVDARVEDRSNPKTIRQDACFARLERQPSGSASFMTNRCHSHKNPRAVARRRLTQLAPERRYSISFYGLLKPLTFCDPFGGNH